VFSRLGFSNTPENGLGVPLPAGALSVFVVADGREQFQGGATVSAIPVGADVDVDSGQAFDVTVERTVLAFDRSGVRNENIDTTQKLVLSNGGARPATVELVETFRGEWRVTRESAPHSQLSAFQAMWRLTVPADGATELEYRAQIGPR